MKKNGHEGFVMAEVLITVMIVMVFGTDHRRQFLIETAARPDCLAEQHSVFHVFHDQPEFPIQIAVSDGPDCIH